MSADPHNDALDQHLRDTIASITEGKQAVTRWALIYEITDGETRVVNTTSSDNATMQDVAGMLTWATEHVRRTIGRILDALDT